MSTRLSIGDLLEQARDSVRCTTCLIDLRHSQSQCQAQAIDIAMYGHQGRLATFWCRTHAVDPVFMAGVPVEAHSNAPIPLTATDRTREGERAARCSLTITHPVDDRQGNWCVRARIDARIAGKHRVNDVCSAPESS
jgi:hypothetical protein